MSSLRSHTAHITRRLPTRGHGGRAALGSDQREVCNFSVRSGPRLGCFDDRRHLSTVTGILAHQHYTMDPADPSRRRTWGSIRTPRSPARPEAGSQPHDHRGLEVARFHVTHASRSRLPGHPFHPRSPEQRCLAGRPRHLERFCALANRKSNFAHIYSSVDAVADTSIRCVTAKCLKSPTASRCHGYPKSKL